MATFTGNPFSNFYKRILQIGRDTNGGIQSSFNQITDGEGIGTPLNLNTTSVKIKTATAVNSSVALTVFDKDDNYIFLVDGSAGNVKVNTSQVYAATQFKEMGLYDFSPTAGVHNPLIATNMMFSDSGDDIVEDTSMFGNGTDPATTLDLSADGNPRVAIACYWYLDNNITLDSVRFMAMADGSATLNFHLFAYTLDNSSNFGDLSNGAVHANGTVSAINSGVKTGTMTLNTANIDADKVVIGFVENATDTSDVSVHFNIKYHIR